METMHTEAKTLSFTKIVTPAGYTHSITVRQGASDGDIKTQLANIKRLDTALQQMNWQPAEARRNSQPPATSNGSQPPAASNGNGSGGPREIFDCQSLVCTIDNGRQYWKISDASHRWKYPVVIYPEVLQKYFNVDTLDTTITYNLSGWKALFVRNDKGNPKKVITLHRPGEAPEQPQPQQVQQHEPPLPPEAQTLQHSDPARYAAGLAASVQPQTVEDEIPF